MHHFAAPHQRLERRASQTARHTPTSTTDSERITRILAGVPLGHQTYDITVIDLHSFGVGN